MYYALSDGVLALVDSGGQTVLFGSDVLEGLALLLEEALDVVLVLDDPLRDDQPPLLARLLPAPPLRLCATRRLRPPTPRTLCTAGILLLLLV